MCKVHYHKCVKEIMHPINKRNYPQRHQENFLKGPRIRLRLYFLTLWEHAISFNLSNKNKNKNKIP